MKREDLGVYVWTSDKNMACLPTWAYLFNKFWPYKSKVRVLGYSKPLFDLPENFEFISLGKQRGPSYWSDDMIEYYKSCEHKYFYAMWEDGFILDYVCPKIFDIALDKAFTNKDDKFFRFGLTLDIQQRPHSIVENFKGFDLIRADQQSEYRQSTQHSIWSKDKFLSKLKPNQSPWDFEMDNSSAMNDGLNVFATKRKYAIIMGHGYLRGKKIPSWYEENSAYHLIPVGKGVSLTKEDIELIESRGWMPEIL
jgi:hypothetical protein